VRWRQVVLLYAVLGVLGGEYWFVERRRVPPPDRPERRRFLPLEAGDVREVRLRRGGRTVVARRAEGAWTVIEPPTAPTPSDLIAAFTVALLQTEEISLVGGADADPHAFGLDERAGRVEVVAGTGEPVVVTIGETNPTGTAVYARRGDRSEVVLIGRNVRYYEDLIFQTLPPVRVPAGDGEAPVGG
jgi:hypothetical protein